MAKRPEVLWCSNPAGQQGRGLKNGKGLGWQFPKAVEKLLREDCAGGSVIHFFGGRSRFGTRIDIDPIVSPDVIADAWLPPFRNESFDTVILDPPYVAINAQMKNALFREASCVARQRVIWFHTIWISTPPGLVPEKSYLIRVGDNCHARVLQYFTIRKRYEHTRFFKRGPGMKYNRWLAQPQGLPFGPFPSTP